MSSFQTVVNVSPAPGVEGDFASSDPAASALAGEGAFITDANGAIVGHFAWVTGNLVNSSGSGVPQGFIHRENQALITDWLGQATMKIPAGREVTLMTRGAFWVRTGTVATIGQKIFASLTTGQIQTGAAGATIAGYIETNFFVGSAGAIGDLIKMTTWN